MNLTVVSTAYRLMDLVVKPHVGDGHPVLGESAGLVGADAGGGAESLDSLQVLHQTVPEQKTDAKMCQCFQGKGLTWRPSS